MALLEDQFIKIGREQLYTEIWEISVAGVAKKYVVPYTELLKLCKENEIPIPPSGYWTKLSFGKPVSKIPLPESSISEILLPINVIPKRSKNSAIASKTDEQVEKDQLKVKETLDKTVIQDEETNRLLQKDVPNETIDDQLVYHLVTGEYNIYNREKLYEEIWSKPVVEVALKYGVSDVAIHKICKALNIPAPPRGYWAKLRTGEKVEKIPLPPTNGATEIKGAKTFESIKITETSLQPLSFMTESGRQKVLQAAQEIKMPDENIRLHKKIIAYKSVINEWNKKDTKPDGAVTGKYKSSIFGR